MDINSKINAANPFDMSIFDDAIAKTDKELENVNKKREEAAEARKAILATDTVFGVGFVQRGMLASITGSFSDGFTKPLTGKAVMNDGTVLTAEEGALMAANTAIKTVTKASQKHASVYVNAGSVARLSGMMKRIKEGSNIVLTKGEAEFVAKYARRYGAHYTKVCNVVFKSIKEAIEAGKVLSFHGLDELGYIPLQYRLPVEAISETVTMKKGFGHISINGRSYNVKARNSYVSGDYELVADNFGRIALEDPIDAEKSPAKALAFKLFQLASRTVVIKTAEEQANVVLEEATSSTSTAA